MEKDVKKKYNPSKIKNLIIFNQGNNPFNSKEESENFYKQIIISEMNFSNDSNTENLNTLLNLYFKGINLYQNTQDTKKLNFFMEKSRLLLKFHKSKRVLKKKENFSPKNHSDNKIITINEKNIQENKIPKTKVQLERVRTIQNVNMNKFKLNFISNRIKEGIKEGFKSKLKLDELNQEYNKIKEYKLKASTILNNDIKKQSDDFKEKLFRKKTMLKKPLNFKPTITIIKEEKVEKISNNQIEPVIKLPKEKNINKSNEPKIKRCKTFEDNINNSNNLNDLNLEKSKSYSIIFNKNNIFNNFNILKNEEIQDKFKIKGKIKKYIEEYNNDIFESYFRLKIKAISDLINKMHSNNIKIYEEYQVKINELMKKQISCENNEEEKILDDDINSLREEQEHEIEKNNDLYEKWIYDEISRFKLFAMSNSSFKAKNLFKNKIKCDIYNLLYNKLTK